MLLKKPWLNSQKFAEQKCICIEKLYFKNTRKIYNLLPLKNSTVLKKLRKPS